MATCPRVVLQTLIMGNRDDIDDMSGGNATVMTTVLKLIDKYNLYGQVAYPKHHKQSDVPEIYRLAAKTKVCRSFFLSNYYNAGIIIYLYGDRSCWSCKVCCCCLRTIFSWFSSITKFRSLHLVTMTLLAGSVRQSSTCGAIWTNSD